MTVGFVVAMLQRPANLLHIARVFETMPIVGERCGIDLLGRRAESEKAQEQTTRITTHRRDRWDTRTEEKVQQWRAIEYHNRRFI